MSTLSDKDIFALIKEGKLELTPLDVSQIQPASIDLRLGSKIQLPKKNECIDLRFDSETIADHFLERDLSEPYTLKPGDIVMGGTLEKIKIPDYCNAKIYNKNSLVSIGLNVSTGCYINPGYEGHMPLLLKNEGVFDIIIGASIMIRQIEICALQTPALRSYDERYNTQKLENISRHFNNLISNKASKRGSLSLYLAERIKNLA